MNKYIISATALVILLGGAYWIYQQKIATPSLGADVSSQEGRQTLSDSLATQDANSIWKTWDAMIARNNPDEYGVVISSMGQSLRKDPSQKVYDEIAKRIYDQSRSIQERMFLLGVLQHAATSEATRILVELAQSLEREPRVNGNISTDKEALLRGAQESIRLASMEFINGSRNWAISTVLEDGWRNFGKAEALSTRSTVANAIVYLGKPEGLSVLIDSVENGGLSSDARGIVLSAISQLSTNDAVSTLGSALIKIKSTQPDVTKALIKGLVSVNSLDAMQALLVYLNQLSVAQKQQMQKEIVATLAQTTLSTEAAKALRGTALEIK